MSRQVPDLAVPIKHAVALALDQRAEPEAAFFVVAGAGLSLVLMLLKNALEEHVGGKGWFVGPWNSEVPVPIGWADEGVNEPHVHHQMYEVYLVACGESVAVVNGQSVPLRAGDMLLVEPGEPHTFTASSDDYLHFVVQTPFMPGDKQLLETDK